MNSYSPQDVNKSETISLIPASKVKGTSVYNARGDSLGSIHDVMLNKRSGQVSYVVMSFGGFLGLGEKYHPIPWKNLTYNEQYGGYVIDLDKRQLENAPAYEPSETPDWASGAYIGTIDKYYDGLRMH